MQVRFGSNIGANVYSAQTTKNNVKFAGDNKPVLETSDNNQNNKTMKNIGYTLGAIAVAAAAIFGGRYAYKYLHNVQDKTSVAVKDSVENAAQDAVTDVVAKYSSDPAQNRRVTEMFANLDREIAEKAAAEKVANKEKEYNKELSKLWTERANDIA